MSWTIGTIHWIFPRLVHRPWPGYEARYSPDQPIVCAASLGSADLEYWDIPGYSLHPPHMCHILSLGCPGLLGCPRIFPIHPPHMCSIASLGCPGMLGHPRIFPTSTLYMQYHNSCPMAILGCWDDSLHPPHEQHPKS